MRRSIHPAAIGILAFTLSLLGGAGDAVAATGQDAAERIIVDSFPVDGFPLTLSEISLTKTKSGYRLKFSAANATDEQLLGIRFWLLIVDSNNKVSGSTDQSEGLKLNPYAAKDFSFLSPSRLKVDHDDRVVLALAQVIGEGSIWEALKAREALEAYAKGESFAMPAVQRFPNQVDSRPQILPLLKR